MLCSNLCDITFLFSALVAADGGCPDSAKCAANCKNKFPKRDIIGGLCAGSQNMKCYCLEIKKRKPGNQANSTSTDDVAIR